MCQNKLSVRMMVLKKGMLMKIEKKQREKLEHEKICRAWIGMQMNILKIKICNFIIYECNFHYRRSISDYLFHP